MSPHMGLLEFVWVKDNASVRNYINGDPISHPEDLMSERKDEKVWSVGVELRSMGLEVTLAVLSGSQVMQHLLREDPSD